jgi:predicted Zn-dependent protease
MPPGPPWSKGSSIAIVCRQWGNPLAAFCCCIAACTRYEKTMRIFLFLALAMLGAAEPLTVGQAEVFLLTGKPAEALTAATTGLAAEPEDAGWQRLQLQALLQLGKYDEAKKAVNAASLASAKDLPLLWTVREVLRLGGSPQEATDIPERVEDLIASRQWAYRDAASLVVYGQALLHRGLDPKEVISKVFAVAQKVDGTSPAPLLAKGELGLQKGDFKLAGKAFQDGLKLAPEHPDLHFGLARAFASSDAEKSTAALDRALEINPQHLPTLLLQAERLIDREDYTAASAKLDAAAAANPAYPNLWALRAVIAHLKNDPRAEEQAREAALRPWPGNPEPEHLLGRKLSQKYRFEAGAAAQKRALAADPKFLPAQAQLASDLLRLGDDVAGWKLAEQVNKEDAYNVAAHNLMMLQDHMREQFTTLETPQFTLRMEKQEAAVYGPRVLELLTKARQVLAEKYGVAVADPTTVEIFSEQKDFGVRTFGMPDNPGYLGVCFGRVVTANSPATNSHPVNWEAVLWHEFCHCVTLQATKNKMPRWLSEGISVYEERQQNPAWGERMTPVYREMLLDDDTLTPVSQLSGAFLSPQSNQHLLFAYYESSLVVEHIIASKGPAALRAILQDLASGKNINESLAARVAPLEKLEADFKAAVRKQAAAYADKLSWDKPPVGATPEEQQEFQSKHPNNYWKLLSQAQEHFEANRLEEAKKGLSQLYALHPKDPGADGILSLLAQTYQRLGDTASEARYWQELTALDSAVPLAHQRLAELETAQGNWAAVKTQAAAWLAINPLIPAPWRHLAKAEEASGNPAAALQAWQAQLGLKSQDPGTIHYQLARLKHQLGDATAKKHVLATLEDNPRHRGALKLLLELPAAE